MNKMDEPIIVVRRADLFGPEDAGAFQGVLGAAERVSALLGRVQDRATTLRRGDAEEDPTFKQVIPYVFLARGHGPDREVFVYERLGGGGEARLHGRLSFGLGGHMNVDPAGDVLGVVRAEACREIDKELVLPVTPTPAELRFAGLLNDGSDAVRRVHLGVLLALDLALGGYAAVRETDQLRGAWMRIDEVLAAADRLDSWSRLALQLLQAERRPGSEA